MNKIFIILLSLTLLSCQKSLSQEVKDQIKQKEANIELDVKLHMRTKEKGFSII